MGAEQAVELFHADDIKSADQPEEFRAQKVKQYEELYADNLALASQVTYIQDIIEPRETRLCLIRSLQLIQDKKVEPTPKRHGNIPL